MSFWIDKDWFCYSKRRLEVGVDFKNENCGYQWKIPSFALRRLITLQLPKQIVSTLWFNQALLFPAKRSAKYVIPTGPKQLVPERIRIAQPFSWPLSDLAVCSRRSVVSVYRGLKARTTEWSSTVTGNSFCRHPLSPVNASRQGISPRRLWWLKRRLKVYSRFSFFIEINPARLLCQMLANSPEVKVL